MSSSHSNLRPAPEPEPELPGQELPFERGGEEELCELHINELPPRLPAGAARG